MKKQFLSFIVLSGLMSGHIGCAEPTKDRSWQQRAKEAAVYEKNVWAKGLPAAYKKWINRKPLTKQEQMYYAGLRNQVGIAAILAVLFGGKKFYDVRQEQGAKRKEREQEMIKRDKQAAQRKKEQQEQEIQALEREQQKKEASYEEMKKRHKKEKQAEEMRKKQKAETN